jgi:hypothetical protein
MFGLFSKKGPEETKKVQLFTLLIQQIPHVNRFSYRKNGKFEVIFDGRQIGELTDLENQAIFNLLSHAWLIVWGNDQAELHVGITNRIGFRLEIDASKIYLGHRFEDHEEKLDELLSKIGMSKKDGSALV